jgi:hypothetical protein
VQYHLSHVPSPFGFRVFFFNSDRVLCFLPRQDLTRIAEITVMNHCTQLCQFFFFGVGTDVGTQGLILVVNSVLFALIIFEIGPYVCLDYDPPM